jgi:hypothetical protein
MPDINRRAFMKESMLVPAVGALAASATAAQAKAPAAAKASLPTGKIGKLSVSRMLLGGNLLTHFTHSRDLKYVYTLAAKYNTEAKILETLALAEQHGVNTLSIHTVPWALEILAKHRKRGGKMQWIICPTAPVRPGLDAYNKQVQQLADMGVDSIYLWGVHADKLAAAGKWDLIAEAVNAPKMWGLPSGLGAHDLNVVIGCEKRKVENDFYIKTFHHHKYPTAPKPDELKRPHSEIPGYWCKDPAATIEVMAKVTKPWIAFKVMAAGAIPPQNAFPYAFQNGADHLLAGMFDFEIAEDVAHARKALAGAQKRPRPWRST